MKLILLLIPLVFSTEISPRSSRTIGSFFGYSSAPKTVPEQQQQQQPQEYQRPLVYQVKYFDGKTNGIDKVGVVGVGVGGQQQAQQSQQYQTVSDGQYQVVPPYYYVAQPYVVPCPVEYVYVGTSGVDRQRGQQGQQQQQQVQPGVVQPIIPVPVAQQDKPVTYNSRQRPVANQVPYQAQFPFSVGQQGGYPYPGQGFGGPFFGGPGGQGGQQQQQQQQQQVPFPGGQGVVPYSIGQQVPFPGVNGQAPQNQAPFYYPDYPYYPYYYNPVVSGDVPNVSAVPYAYLYKSYVSRDPVVASAASTQQQQRVDKDGTKVTENKKQHETQQ